MFRTLLKPRYAALTLLMVILAGVCITLGVWQIARLAGKISANDELRHNAHTIPAPVATVLPTVGQRRPSSDSIQFRTVRATGTYDAAGQVLVRQRSVDSDTGYLVLTPLRTDSATLHRDEAGGGRRTRPGSGAGTHQRTAPCREAG
ncbi:MAG: hypothetical protein JO147_05975 [Actinobacteria bacterium]|nr:hypothetical protein [Actinomycetota bacterium]